MEGPNPSEPRRSTSISFIGLHIINIITLYITLVLGLSLLTSLPITYANLESYNTNYNTNMINIPKTNNVSTYLSNLCNMNLTNMSCEQPACFIDPSQPECIANQNLPNYTEIRKMLEKLELAEDS